MNQLRNRDAGIAGHPTQFAPKKNDDATSALSAPAPTRASVAELTDVYRHAVAEEDRVRAERAEAARSLVVATLREKWPTAAELWTEYHYGRAGADTLRPSRVVDVSGAILWRHGQDPSMEDIDGVEAVPELVIDYGVRVAGDPAGAPIAID